MPPPRHSCTRLRGSATSAIDRERSGGPGVLALAPAGGLSRCRGLLIARERQGEGEHRSVSDLARDPDRAPVESKDVAYDGEPDSGPFVLPARRRIDLVEALEDLLERVLGNADTGIGDVHLEEPSPALARGEGDPSSLRVELDRVGQKIDQDLPDLHAVTAHDQIIGLVLRRDREVFLPHALADHLDRLIDDLPERDILQMELRVALFDA